MITTGATPGVPGGVRAYIDDSLSMLVIGRPGVDGLVWGYRKTHPGIWVYYPVDDEYRLIAATVADLHEGYSSGRIAV